MFGKQKSAYWTQRTHLLRPDVYECSACGHEAKKPTRECLRCHAVMRSQKYDPSWVDEAEILDIIAGDGGCSDEHQPDGIR